MRKISVLRKIVLVAMIFPFLILSSCGETNSNKSNDDKQKLNHILIYGQEVILVDAVAQMIEVSDIKKKGYVVIIPTYDIGVYDNSKNVKRLFNEQQIMAVHILNPSADSAIKKSEIIAIQNATIVCFVGYKSSMLNKITKKAEFKDAIFDAFTHGALISSIGGASSVFSNYYLWINNNNTSDSNKVTIETGLGLLNNLIIEKTNIFEDNKTAIENKLINSNLDLIKMNNDAIFYINANDKSILKELVDESDAY